jgi:hypothetical protein
LQQSHSVALLVGAHLGRVSQPVTHCKTEEIAMLHGFILAAQQNPEAAGFILKGIKGIFVAIGSIIAAIVCGVIAGVKGRNPFGWGILGLFFSILTLIVIVVIPSKDKK